MGFFDFSEQEKTAARQPGLKGLSIDLLHKKQCLVCPLNSYDGARNPHMLPSGSDKPLVYMIGERPRKSDDRLDDHFTGEVGDVLRMRISDDWLSHIRFNNIVRTLTPDGRLASTIEIECCRPSIIKDIEDTKPKAIFGFGPAVLDWAIQETHIQRWMGRHVPVKIGKHTCWFFPMLEPGFVLESRKFTPRGEDSYGSDMEFAFAAQLRSGLALVEKLPAPNVMPEGEVFRDVEFITGELGWADVDRIKSYLRYAAKQKFVGFDYETNCLRPYQKGSKLLTCGVATADKALAFPLRHRQSPWSSEQLNDVEQALEDFLYESECRKISHQLSFEHEWTGVKFGRDAVLTDTWECSVSQAFILNETPYTNSLDFLCKQYFGIRIKGMSDVDRKNLDAVELKQVLQYNAADAKFHRLLFFVQRAVLEEQNLQWVYEYQRDRVAAFVLTQMAGIPVDQKVASGFFDDYEGRLKKIERRIADLDVARQYEKRFAEKFSPSNNHHVKRMLQNVLKLKIDATNEKAIRGINHEFTRALLKYRSVAKNLGTYVEPVLTGSKNVFPDGMLHPIISTTKVRTNRTSSEDPNIQNWPKHKEGKVIRKVVRPLSDDYRVVSIDFSSIQARNVAMESRDETLVDGFWNNYDIHTDWRERILRVYPDWIPREQRHDKKVLAAFRQRAKNEFVFAAFFGAQAFTLARGTGVPENLCEQLREEFYDTFPGIEAWHKQLMRDFAETGYVTGLSGFRRRAPIAANQIINSPIQADEALIVCDAMGRLSRKGKPDLQPILMVHDDLTFIWHKRDIDANSDECIYEMVQKKFDWINVPLGVEISIGRDWHTMEKIGEYVWTKSGYKEVHK